MSASASGFDDLQSHAARLSGASIAGLLEDEPGRVHVIGWPSLADAQRREVLGSSLQGVCGVWQSHQGVRSLVAKRLVDLSGLLGKLNTESRNFH